MTEPVTVDNIDAYMSKLHATITESPQSHERLAAAVRDIVGRLSMEGLVTLLSYFKFLLIVFVWKLVV
jgi:hypothetical protein